MTSAPASETLRGSVISYKRGEKPSCGQHLAAARWPAVFSSISMGFDANPRSSTDAGTYQLQLSASGHESLSFALSNFEVTSIKGAVKLAFATNSIRTGSTSIVIAKKGFLCGIGAREGIVIRL